MQTLKYTLEHYYVLNKIQMRSTLYYFFFRQVINRACTDHV